MTLTIDPARSPSTTATPPGHRGRTWAALAVALVAAGVLLATAPGRGGTPDPGGPLTASTAWPHAQRADIPGNLPDGPVFTPSLFLDAHTAVGTAPSPDARSSRLLIREADGRTRELRRLPVSSDPVFDTVTAAGDTIAWTERVASGNVQIWAADRRGGGRPRRLVTDAGHVLFYASPYDLVIADGRIQWAAAPSSGRPVTEIRSVRLTGGPVSIRTEPGEWGLTAWPWLTDGNAQPTGTTRLRNLATGRDVKIQTSGAELATCTPTWCRVTVMSGGGVARIDLMHPDGSARRRIAGGTAGEAVPDVAVLDRFEILAQPEPYSDMTGTEALLVYDIATRRTVNVSAAVTGAGYGSGVLWWSTGNQDSIVWHTLDLRTV